MRIGADDRPRLLGDPPILHDDIPAAGHVAELLERERPLTSWINLGEVLYVLARSQGEEPAMEAVRDIRRVLEVELPSAALVLEAGRLKARYPLAYADAFAAATAIAHDATLWTGDPALCIEGCPWRWRDLR